MYYLICIFAGLNEREDSRPTCINATAYDVDGSLGVRVRTKADIVSSTELLDLLANGHRFIAIWTNGATRDLCFASNVKNYLKVRRESGGLLASSRDAHLVSACHMWSYATKLHVMHLDVVGPFLFGEEALFPTSQSRSPSELLNGLFVDEDGVPLNIPWASHIFAGFLRDSETISAGTAELETSMTISEVMDEVRTRWDAVAENQYKSNPDSSLCVLGIGSRGFYVPPTVAGAERSRANKKLVFGRQIN